MGNNQAVVERQQRVVRGQRLRVGHIKCGPGDDLVPQGCIQGLRINNRPACGVHQKSGRLHLFELRRRDELVRFRTERNQHDHKIRLAQQSVHLDPGASELRLGLFVPTAIMVEHPHIKTVRPPGDGGSNTPQTDNAQRGLMHVRSEKDKRAPHRPLAGPHAAFAFADTAGDTQHEREGEVGRGFGQNARRVGQDNVATGQRRDIHIVIPDGHIGDDPELGRLVEQVVINAFRDHAQQGNGIAQLVQQGLTRNGLLRLPDRQGTAGP